VPTNNHLLTRLLPQDFALLSGHLEAIDLPFRFTLEAANRPIPYVYFPENGLVSVVATGARDQSIEVGVIGRDGVTGHCLLLGADRTPNTMYMQVAGKGLRIGAQPLLEAIKKSNTLNMALQGFLQCFTIQASHTALANGRAKLEVRLARWLVMAHDRLDGDRLALTHEFLAVMLGVHRPGVTISLQKLETKGLIETHRNAVVIKDRAGLEKLADGVYGVPEAEQERLTGWRSPHRA
jgi:CRP-like cAMP-binding protein